MDTFVILRRSGWATPEDLSTAGERSTAAGAEDADVNWIRSYVLTEPDGRLGTVCVYQATSPDAVRRHAQASDLPVDEIIPVGDLVIIQPDPT